MKHVSAPAVTAVRASLHIEELVIRGLPGLNPRAIGDAVQTRLALLLGEIDGAAGDLGERTRLTAPTIRIGADARAEEIGNEIARAVCDALAGARGDRRGTNMQAGGVNQTTAAMKTQDV